MKQLTHPKQKHRIPWISWSVALTVIGAIGFFAYPRLTNRTNSNATQVTLIEAKTGTVEDIINESGIVELQGQQTLEAPGDGTVAEVLVRVGDRFNFGQRLVLLVDPERATSTYEQNLNYQKKQIALATKEREVADARIDLKLKQENLERERELFEKGFISENEFRNKQEEVRKARSNSSKAEQGLFDAKLDLKLQDLERTKKIAEQQKNLVTAPVSGKVLEIEVKRGDVVQLGDPLLTIGNPQQQTIKLQISTLNATKVKLGQTARISKIGPNSQIYTGKVSSLSLIATTENNSNSNNSSQPTVSATVELDTPSQQLIPGSQVSVDIVLVREKDSIVLPSNAIVRDRGPAFVWVVSDRNTAAKQPVTLGLEGITSVAIQSGLKPADKVILPSPTTVLTEGMSVRGTGQ